MLTQNSPENIRKELESLSEENYRIFSSKLLPAKENLLGIRLPKLRKIAKRIASDPDYAGYLKTASDEFLEETMLQGMVLGYLKCPVTDVLQYTKKFIPKIQNWSVCDSTCAGLKIARSNAEIVWNFLQPYIRSDSEFEARFAVVMLLDHYICEEWIDRVLLCITDIRQPDYYARMAIAWEISICFVKFPEKTLAWLKSAEALDDFTFNKALQKITESHQVSSDYKKSILKMKRLKK